MAQDAALPREADQIPHGQEVRRVAQFVDELEFVFDQPAHFVGYAARITLASTDPRQVAEMLDRSQPARAEFLRVLVPQFVEREVAAVADLDRVCDRVGAVAKQRRHLGGRLEMPFRVGIPPLTQLGHRAAVTDRRQNILQPLSLAHMAMHVIGRHQRDARLPRELPPFRQQRLVIRATMQFSQCIRAVAEGGGQLSQPERARVRFRAVLRTEMVFLAVEPDARAFRLMTQHSPRQQTGRVLGDVGERQPTFPLRSVAAAARDQPAEVRVAGAVHRPEHDRRRVNRRNLGTDQQLELRGLRGDVRPHDSREAVAIGDRQRGQTQLGRAGD